jgi:two-component sensor histidine kinase
MRRSNLSFRNHLTALGMLVALPFIAAGAGVSTLYVRSQISSTEDQLAGVAKEVSGAIDRQLGGRLAALAALSFSPQLQEQDYRSFYEQARKTAELFPGIIVLRSADGQQLVNTAVGWGDPLPRSTDPVLREADNRAIRTNRSVVSDLYVGTPAGVPFVIVEFPVKIGGATYLLSGMVPPTSVLEVLRSSTALREQWRLVVIDRRHRIVARTVEHYKYLGTQASADFADRLADEHGVLRSRTLDGLDVVNGYFKSPLSGWITIVSVDGAAFYKPLHNALLAVAIIGVSGLALSLLAAILYSRYITPPIWRIREDALALAARRQVQPFGTGIRELDAVSRALASSSEALRQEHQSNRVLINELNHRVKNTLATVQAIAAQTLRGANVDPAVREALESRLMALSNAHSTLTSHRWEGAEIQQIIAQAVAPHTTPDRIRLDGPPIRLPPRSALAIAMGMHELATNAVKYGSLSNGSGLVSIAWSVDDGSPRKLRLQWHESGGPPVTSPRRRGFGSRLIERNLAHDLDGSATISFQSDGVICTITGEVGSAAQTGGLRR